jgi:hypothetical protein
MYDKKNLEAIEKAISDMHAGRRIVGVSYGDTRVQYANITLAECKKLPYENLGYRGTSLAEI